MYSSAINAVVQTTLSQTTSTTRYWAATFANMYNLKLLETIVASLSIFGSLTIIITYFIFEDLQTTTRKFLVYISFGDFFTVFPYLIEAWATYRHGTRNVHREFHTDCEAQSFVSTTAVMWSFFWTSSLAIYLYIVIVRKNQDLADKLMPYFHVVNWGLPLALNGVALGRHRLGTESSRDSGGWCWIKVDHGEKHMGRTIGWMLACGKLWEILSYFIDVILCFIVTRKINAEVEERRSGSLTDSARATSLSETTQTAIRGKKKLIWAPVLFVLLRIWGTIRFLLFCFRINNQSRIFEAIIVCHIIGDSSQGFVYFIMFCLCTPKFRENVCCSKKKNTSVQRRGTSRGTSSSGKSQEHKYLLHDPEYVVFYT